MKFNLAIALLAVFATAVTAAPSPIPSENLQQTAEVQNDGDFIGPLLKLGSHLLPKIIGKVVVQPKTKSVAPVLPAKVAPIKDGAIGAIGRVPPVLSTSGDGTKPVAGDDADDDDDDDDDKEETGKPQLQPSKLLVSPVSAPRPFASHATLPFPLRFPGRLRQY